MTSFAFSRSASRLTPPAFARPNILAALHARLVAAWVIRRAERALSGMDDALLHDIGVGRAEIGDAVRHGRRPRG